MRWLEPGDEWTVVRAADGSEVSVNEVAVADGETRALLPGDRLLYRPGAGESCVRRDDGPR